MEIRTITITENRISLLIEDNGLKRKDIVGLDEKSGLLFQELKSHVEDLILEKDDETPAPNNDI